MMVATQPCQQKPNRLLRLSPAITPNVPAITPNVIRSKFKSAHARTLPHALLLSAAPSEDFRLRATSQRQTHRQPCWILSTKQRLQRRVPCRGFVAAAGEPFVAVPASTLSTNFSWLGLSVYLTTITTVAAAVACFIIYVRPMLQAVESAAKEVQTTAEQMQKLTVEVEKTATMIQAYLPSTMAAVESASLEVEDLTRSVSKIALLARPMALLLWLSGGEDQGKRETLRDYLRNEKSLQAHQHLRGNGASAVDTTADHVSSSTEQQRAHKANTDKSDASQHPYVKFASGVRRFVQSVRQLVLKE